MLGRRDDGSEVPCEVALSSMGNALEEVLIWTLRDVTLRTEIENQKKALEKELEQAHRLESLGTLAGGIGQREVRGPSRRIQTNRRDDFAGQDRTRHE